MISAHSANSETKLVAVVRDKNGNVKLDDYENIPDEVLQVLTKEDFNYIQTIRGNK
jgi:ribosome maturation factor RimP